MFPLIYKHVMSLTESLSESGTIFPHYGSSPKFQVFHGRAARCAVTGAAREADCFRGSSNGPHGCPARLPEVPLSSS